MTVPERDHYAVLGIRPTADRAEVQRAWRAAARRHHPDVGGDPAAMQAVSEAWAVLGDPERRRSYDRTRVRGLPGGDSPRRWVWESSGAGAEGVDDLLDDQPLRYRSSGAPGSSGPRVRMAVVPPALFLLSIVVASVALVLDEPAVLGVAALVFALSCVSVFVVALFAMRGPRRR